MADAAARLETADVSSPIGPLVVAARQGALCALSFGGRDAAFLKSLERRFGPCTLVEARDPAGAVAGLRAYFAGELTALDAIAVDPGGTPFQQRVWQALRAIAPGRTVAYSGLARRLGDPLAVRAVAGANARNPVAIVIPCHRVIGADGSLIGYGGGLERKRWLLAHEGARLLPDRPLQPNLPL